MTLSEIAGPVLASIAVVLSVIVFKRTVDYQAYKDVDSDYREVLKIGLDHPDFRNLEWTSEYTKKDPKEKLSYEQYAFMIWNIIEAIFDRGTIDKTWIPVIILEKKLHYKWLEQNRDKFKDKFLNYVDNKTNPPCPANV